MKSRRELLADLVRDNGFDILFADGKKIKAILKDYKIESKDIAPLQIVLSICSSKEKLLSTDKEDLIDEICDNSYLREDFVSDIIDDLYYLSGSGKKKAVRKEKNEKTSSIGHNECKEKKCILCGNPSVQTKVEEEYLCRKCLTKIEAKLPKDYEYSDLEKEIEKIKKGVTDISEYYKSETPTIRGGKCCICGIKTKDYKIKRAYCCNECLPKKCRKDPENYTVSEIKKIIADSKTRKSSSRKTSSDIEKKKPARKKKSDSNEKCTSVYGDSIPVFYEGDSRIDSFVGRAKYVFSNGDTVEANWINGGYYGFGKYTRSNGDYYEGNFVKCLKHGKGKMVWADGGVYVGDFYNGYRTGKGKLTYPDGVIYKGDFLRGHCTGYGKIYDWDGWISEGPIKDGVLNGPGKLIDPLGNASDGYWDDGHFSSP